MWGALTVTLREAANARGSGVPTAPATGTVHADNANQARVGGRARSKPDLPPMARALPSAKPIRQAQQPALTPPLPPVLEATQAPAPADSLLPATPIETSPDIAGPAPDQSALPTLAPTFDQVKPVTPLTLPAPDPAHASQASPAPAPVPDLAPTPVPTREAALAPTTAAPPRSTPSEQTPVGAPERSTAAPPALSAAPLLGAPDAGSRLGRDVATPPSAPASAPRRPLDLSLPRGGALSSRGGRGLLQLMAPPPETPSKLTKGIEKAAREDCRQAYGGAGLLAVIPLAVDAARDKGCRW